MEQFVPPVGLSARMVNFGVGEALPPVRLRKFAYLPMSACERCTRDLDLPLATQRTRDPRGPPTHYPFPGEVSPFVTIQEKAMPGSGR